MPDKAKGTNKARKLEARASSRKARAGGSAQGTSTPAVAGAPVAAVARAGGKSAT